MHNYSVEHCTFMSDHGHVYVLMIIPCMACMYMYGHGAVQFMVLGADSLKHLSASLAVMV